MSNKWYCSNEKNICNLAFYYLIANLTLEITLKGGQFRSLQHQALYLHTSACI